MMASGLRGLLRIAGPTVCGLLAFLGGAMLAAQPSRDGWIQLDFAHPVLDGMAVDKCLASDSGCGPMAADQFCRSQGFDRASRWEAARTALTRTIGTGQVCDGKDGRLCSALRNVTCTRPPVPDGGEVFARPVFNDLPVDACASLDGACAQTSANEFCRTHGYEQAAHWATIGEETTWNIRAQRACRSSAGNRCAGLRNVVCVPGPGSRLKHPELAVPTRLAIDAPRLSIGGEARQRSTSPFGDFPSAPLADRLYAMHGKLSSDNAARLYADVAMIIAEYGRAPTGMRTEDATDGEAAHRSAWDAYYRYNLQRGSGGAAESVIVRLRQIDRNLIGPTRAALTSDVDALIRKYGG
jgi:hypothetical protein